MNNNRTQSYYLKTMESDASLSDASFLEEYRANAQETERERSLLKLLGSGETALDIGTLDGYYARHIQQRYRSVVAFDLEDRQIPGCQNVAGDVRKMTFADNSFDLVFCAEVLEHVPGVEQAAAEIVRVCRKRAVIGVPYKQDIRVGRVTCATCGKIAPPWGHVNSFDEDRLKSLFAGMEVESIDFVGENRSRTTGLATALMDMGGNPWGVYSHQFCMHCSAALQAPPSRTFAQKVLSAIAFKMNQARDVFTKTHGNWIHIAFVKR